MVVFVVETITLFSFVQHHTLHEKNVWSSFVVLETVRGRSLFRDERRTTRGPPVVFCGSVVRREDVEEVAS